MTSTSMSVAEKSSDKAKVDNDGAIRQALVGITLFVGVTTLYFWDMIAV